MAAGNSDARFDKTEKALKEHKGSEAIHALDELHKSGAHKTYDAFYKKDLAALNTKLHKDGVLPKATIAADNLDVMGTFKDKNKHEYLVIADHHTGKGDEKNHKVYLMDEKGKFHEAKVNPGKTGADKFTVNPQEMDKLPGSGEESKGDAHKLKPAVKPAVTDATTARAERPPNAEAAAGDQDPKTNSKGDVFLKKGNQVVEYGINSPEYKYQSKNPETNQPQEMYSTFGFKHDEKGVKEVTAPTHINGKEVPEVKLNKTDAGWFGVPGLKGAANADIKVDENGIHVSGKDADMVRKALHLPDEPHARTDAPTPPARTANEKVEEASTLHTKFHVTSKGGVIDNISIKHGGSGEESITRNPGDDGSYTLKKAGKETKVYEPHWDAHTKTVTYRKEPGGQEYNLQKGDSSYSENQHRLIARGITKPDDI